METLKLTSCMAANSDFIGRNVTAYIARRLKIPATFVNDISWQERERRLDEGEIHGGWICGLPYVRKVDQSDPQLELLAAPVMQGERYQGRPIYFSDVVVHRDSPFETFADLRGASWAYNEPGSQSGYYVTRYHLAQLGETSGYFGRVVQSGAHQTSLQMVLDGQVDASAIDCTVLELELERYPEIEAHIRIIETLGPSPIPPWVISKQLPPSFRQELRTLLVEMHHDPAGRQILEAGHISQFAAVEDRDYDPIRRMAQQAEQARL
jgi:phosphonate transport system substrate-binding protein